MGAQRVVGFPLEVHRDYHRGVLSEQLDCLSGMVRTGMRAMLNHSQTLSAAQFLNRSEVCPSGHESAGNVCRRTCGATSVNLARLQALLKAVLKLRNDRRAPPPGGSRPPDATRTGAVGPTAPTWQARPTWIAPALFLPNHYYKWRVNNSRSPYRYLTDSRYSSTLSGYCVRFCVEVHTCPRIFPSIPSS